MIETPGIFAAPPEPPVGTVAHLRAPYKFPATYAHSGSATAFRRYATGRWGNVPTNEISFASFADLNAAAPVAELELPADARDVPVKIALPRITVDVDADAVPEAAEADPMLAAQKTAGKAAGLLIGGAIIGAIGLYFLTR